MKKNNKKISFIIVNYNSGNYLYHCVKSIDVNLEFDYEIIIIDNNSNDSSIKKINFKNSKIVTLKKNKGFARANNIGTKLSSGHILHFLNPDCLVDKNINELYKKIINNSDFSVGVNKLCDLDNKIQKSKHLIPNFLNVITKLFFPKKAQYWYLGASIIINRKIYDKIGGWSEDYKLYSEDLDFFYKINKNNYKIIEYDEKIIHCGEVSTSKKWNEYERFIKKELSVKIFLKKNFSLYSYYLYLFVVIIFRLFFVRNLAKMQIRYYLNND